jgi:Tfp pilus assembly major pilin PilA
METNWMVIAPIVVGIIALIIFLIVRNLKDKNDLIAALNAQELMNVIIEEKKDTEDF